MTGIDIERARDLIRHHSDLAAPTVELLGAGTDSTAFRVDTEWVVRFPLVPEADRSAAMGAFSRLETCASV